MEREQRNLFRKETGYIIRGLIWYFLVMFLVIVISISVLLRGGMDRGEADGSGIAGDDDHSLVSPNRISILLAYADSQLCKFDERGRAACGMKQIPHAARLSLLLS